MPYQCDRNVGRCSFHTCESVGPRCDAFMCAVCCALYHKSWVYHKLADGSVTQNTDTDSRLPAVYGGADQKADPPEWDYGTHPPEFGEIVELDEERVYLPLSNYRANKEWPADYVG